MAVIDHEIDKHPSLASLKYLASNENASNPSNASHNSHQGQKIAQIAVARTLFASTLARLSEHISNAIITLLEWPSKLQDVNVRI